MAIFKRTFPPAATQDLGALGNLTYSHAAGAVKTTTTGLALDPLLSGDGVTFTTNATSALALPAKGKSLAIYNNSSSLGSITFGTSSAVTVLAPGVTNATGQVGIPCLPNAWTYVSAYQYQWVIASASTLLVFLVSDSTSITQQA